MSGDLRLNDLCSIILRFRLHKYGMCTDIEKAFLHVHLNEEDRDFTRFLWLRNPSDPESELITFRFRVVLFGAVCSPFILNATLLYHISQYTSATSKDMLENLYVDNIITGCESEETAITYYQTARAIMKDANFNLRSWASNSHRLVEQMHNDKTAAEPGPINVLGLQWDTTNDTMSLTLKIPIPTRHTLVTKREVLHESSKVFDPIGILSPVTVRAKILIQKLWQQDIDWDEPLNKAAEEEWLSIAADIQDAINLLSITRRYFHALNLSGQTVKLHVFADASPRAYGAVAFICGDDQVSFVMAKSRVAPLKQLSLPRLELMAALTAARLSKFIRDALHSLNIITHLWADSQIVLHWLQSNKNLNSFVHHRVSEIHQLTNDATWNFCPTSDNPADLLTRGITSSQLKSSTLWNHGPEWLTSTSNWPTWQATPALRLQALAITSAVFIPNEKQNSTHGLHTIIDVTDHSTFYKLIAVTAYVMRFIHFSRGNRNTGPLATAELQQAKHMWIKDCQRQVFSKEGTNLQSNPPAAKRLPLVRQLRLFLDKNNCLRCGGRIHNAPLSQLSKFPFLLPPHHPLTNLIIRSTHLRLLHAGTNSTLTALRQEFWVPTARQRVIRKCTTCKKYSGKFYPNPDPAPLPEIRVRDAPPFTVTGVDFTGALYVQEHNQESKVYICLYTCANTRAIHLEVVTDLSVDMFLLSFRRFASRRSLPSIMVSDNASTYQSAAEELQQLFRSKELTHHLSKQGVQWQFIPKRAPWYGGWWERLIGLTKSTLKKVLGRARISLTTLQALVAEVEAVLNDRPLTYVSSDITDLEPLTPSHLLYGRRISSLPYIAVDKEEIDDPTYGSAEDVDRRAKRQALTLQHFRRRWRDEYLTSLREFHQGTGKNKQTIKVGDVVLVHNDTPRTMWKLAVIESLIKGNDGLVRAANIRTATGKTNRPIARLVPLEVSSSIDDPIQHTSQTTNAATTTPGVGPSTEVTYQGGRPRREAAQRGMERVANWIQQMRAPREDVMN